MEDGLAEGTMNEEDTKFVADALAKAKDELAVMEKAMEEDEKKAVLAKNEPSQKEKDERIKDINKTIFTIEGYIEMREYEIRMSGMTVGAMINPKKETKEDPKQKAEAEAVKKALAEQ